MPLDVFACMNTVVTDAVEIPGYRIMKAVGVGGMASVYLAVQESLDREVALKVMSPTLAENAEFADRFLKEGRLTAKLSHPNLVTVYDIGLYGQVYYLAQEYIPGGTLREKMNAGMTVPEILDVARDVAQGLAYAHEKSVVHRDVKPGNVLFRANGTAVLADFGIAKAMDSKTMSTQAGNSIGTPHYMSPEQARAEKVDGRSDIYSLGAMMFEMLAGTPPYDASDPFSIALMHVTHPVPQLPPKVAWLQPLIDRMMAKMPDARFSTGDEFVAGCDKLFSSAPEAQLLRDAQMTRKRALPRSLAMQPTERIADPMRTPRRVPAASVPFGWWQSNAGKSVLAAVAGIVIVVAASAAWLAIRDDEAPAPKVTTALTLNSDELDSAIDPQSPTLIEDLGADPMGIVDEGPALLVDGDVSELLAIARDYVKTGMQEGGRRLSSPRRDNAIEIYQEVLRRDAGNVEASNGLERIADYYENKAKNFLDRGTLTACAVIADAGLLATPNRASLIALQKQCTVSP